MDVDQFERIQVGQIAKRVSRVSHTRIVAIIGPHQVGKTTIVHERNNDYANL